MPDSSLKILAIALAMAVFFASNRAKIFHIILDQFIIQIGIIYEKSSFAYGDTTNMITVIDNFFASVGIDDTDEPSKIKMYPNPVTNILTIENASQSQFSVYDAAGKLIYSAMINDEVWTLNTDFLPAGIYVTEFVNDLNFESQRLVVE